MVLKELQGIPKPLAGKPARLLYDASSRMLFLEYVGEDNNYYRIPLIFVALPQEFNKLADQLGLESLLSINISLPGVELAKVSGVSLTGRDWSSDFAKLQNLDTALSSRASEATLQSVLSKLDTNLSTRASETTLSAIKSKTDNLDVLLSSRASEATLSAIKNALASVGTDKMRVSVVDALPQSPFTLYDSTGAELSSYVKNLDVALSTRASEATLSAIKNALASVGADEIRATVVDALPESPFNISKVGGTPVTGRDWSSDFAKLQNLDIALSAHRDAMLAKLDEVGKLVLIDYTTTPLPANASWVSAVDPGPNTGRIVGSVYADQAGTLYVEQSPDGANWDVVDSFSVSAGSGLGFSVEKVCPYARVRYVNGATAQAVFRLYVYKRLRVI